MGAMHNYQANPEWPPLIRNILELAFNEVIKRFDNVLNEVEPQLLALARESEEDSEKDRIISATETFYRSRDLLCEAFTEKWEEICGRLVKKAGDDANDSKSVAADKLDLSHLSILGEEELQEKIALQNLSSSAAQELKYLLVPIRSGIEQAMPGYVINRSTIAFFPTALAECVFEGLQALETDGDIRRHVLLLFRQQFFTSIDSLFKLIGQMFEEQGFSLEQLSAVNRPPQPGPQQAPPSAQPQGPGYSQGSPQAQTHGTAPSDTLSQELGQLIQHAQVPAHLMSGGGGSFGSLSAVPADLNPDMSIVTVSNKEVGKMLETMQSNVSASKDSGETPDIHKTMAHLLKSNASPNSYRVMSQMGENVINMVSLLFDFILQNDNIAPVASNLIMRLQIPYMRLAVSDSSLFSNREHPARKLLNTMAELAVGISDTESPGYLKIHAAVEQLTQQYSDDPQQVESLQEELASFLETLETESKDKEETTQKQAASEEQQEIANSAATQVVNGRINEIDNSLIFHSLLEKVWAEVLKTIYLRHGMDTEQWNTSVLLLDDIIWSTLAGDNDKKKLLTALPKLVPEVESTFSQYDIDELVRSHFLDQLHEIHINIIKGKSGNTILDQDLEHSSAVKLIVDEIEEEEQIKEEQELAEKEELAVGADFKGDDEHEVPVIEEAARLDTKAVLDIVSGLRPGVWMEYMVKGEPVRCKIAFYAPNQEKYIFVEGSGRKLFDRIRPELVVDIQDKLAKVVEGGDLFEKAMSSVVASIRDQRQAG